MFNFNILIIKFEDPFNVNVFDLIKKNYNPFLIIKII